MRITYMENLINYRCNKLLNAYEVGAKHVESTMFGTQSADCWIIEKQSDVLDK